jgi:transposase
VIDKNNKYAKYDQVAIRRQALLLYLEKDFHPEFIAKIFSVSPRSVYRWIGWFNKKGWHAFQIPKPARRSKLNESQFSELADIILTKTPLDLGFDTVLWTRAIIAQVILKKFSISLHETTIGRILKINKLTPQKPIRKSYRQDKEEARQFREDFFPRLLQKSISENAVIVWLDETSISSESNVRRTWGLAGKTPIIPSNGEREKINVIGTIDQNGLTHFMTYEGTTDSQVVISYIDQLAKTKKNKIYLILDNASYHKSHAVKQHVQEFHSGWLDLIYLPPYSPELNPCELVWAHLKSHGINRILTKTKLEFINAVEKHLSKFMLDKELGLSLFGKKELDYIWQEPSVEFLVA